MLTHSIPICPRLAFWEKLNTWYLNAYRFVLFFFVCLIYKIWITPPWLPLHYHHFKKGLCVYFSVTIKSFSYTLRVWAKLSIGIGYRISSYSGGLRNFLLCFLWYSLWSEEAKLKVPTYHRVTSRSERHLDRHDGAVIPCPQWLYLSL